MNENDSDHIQARVAVVGGGLAGCTAALRLVEQGFSDVVVLEAADSPGGRVGTMSIVGQNLDSGAQFIGPEQTELLAIAAQLGLSEVPMYTDGQDIVRHVPGSNHPELEYFVTAIDEVAASLDLAAPWAHPDAVHLETSSVDAWAHTLGVTDRDALAYIASIVESFVGAQSGDVSVLWFATFVAGAGGWEQATKETLSSRIDGGAGQIIDRLAERLGDRVLVNSPVTAVVQGESSVTLTAGGVRVTADRVVLACSPNELCRMTFTPQLPAQRNELNSNWSFGGGVKFAVAYERPFWRDSELSGTIMPGPTTPVSRIWDNSPTDGSPVGILVGLASRRHVQSMLPPTEEARRTLIEEYIATSLGIDVPPPIGYVESIWADKQWISGCTTANRPGTMLTCWPTIREPIGRLHFAGTETSEHFTGYMEGAVRSGSRAAREVGALLRHNPTV